MDLQFSPDLPIASPDEDRLNRSSFAAALVKAIKGWRQKSSLVMALYGEWGSGKSSIKNMLLASLDESLVVDFNPWQITNRDRLTEAFFNDVGATLGRPRTDKQEDKEAAESRASKWKLYGSLFGILHRVAQFGAPVAGAYFAAHGYPEGVATTHIVTASAAEAAGLAKTGADALAAAGTAFTPTLAQMRKELNKLLEELDTPIIVVLDDVDRLTKDEIRLMLQLIKANADFPNIIYLLLAQRSVLEDALDGLASEKGSDYLEKIVQVFFNVPQVDQRQLEKILFEGLDKLIAHEAISKRWNQERWAAVFLAMRPLLAHLRDVKRYLSSLAFHFSVFQSDDSFEVNPVDLIGIEALRVFVPKMYEALPDLKAILTDEHRFGRKEEVKEEQATLTKALEQVPQHRRAVTESLLKELFPAAENVLKGSGVVIDTGILY
jgi:predicted KAP-like P-loop ATPase